jgi:CSLREA domain-containing protein
MTRAHSGRARSLALCLLLAASAGGVLSRPVDAATFLINSIADTDDGACDPAPAGCTLREAILAANLAAGPDTLRFDPAVFPLGTPQTIAVQTALPHLIEPAGNVVDGRGAGVVIDGAALDPVLEEAGLVVESGAVQALGGVEIRQIAIRSFGGHGLHICAGVFPECLAPLSATLVSGVVASTNGMEGIFVDGLPNVGTRVESSVVRGNGGDGIRLNGGSNEDLVKAVVASCSASANAGRGINLNAGRDNIGSTVTASVAVENGSAGINLNAGSAVRSPRVLDSVASSNGTGIVLNAGSELSGAIVKGNTAAGNVTGGITVEGSGSKLKQNRVTGNGTEGIELRAPGGGNRIDKNHAGGNLAAGIVVRDGNGGNRVKQNLALGSLTDLVDEAAGCDANLWQKNVFASASQPCVR